LRFAQDRLEEAMIFSQEQLAKIVAESLPSDARPGEKVVIGTVDQHGAQVVASFKLKDHWELQAAARHEWSGENEVGARVLLRW
jgi:hypothetical protein